jgi:four helix bundle protein
MGRAGEREPAKSFRELVVWQKAHELVLEIYRLSGLFPKEEIYGLTSQLRRAGVAVPANIAEGFNRSGESDKLKFFNYAVSSLEECRYYLILAEDLDYADGQAAQEQLEEVSKLLNSYVKAVRSKEKE